MRRCRFGLFEFDLSTGELRREGEIVKLAPQPTKVLGLLLERPGDLVTRDQLKSHVWGDETFVDFERGLNFCIQQVRAALGDTSDNPRFVQTVPRKGYRFIAPAAVPADGSSESGPAEDAQIPAARMSPVRMAHSRRWAWIFAAATVLVAVPVAGLVLAGRSGSTTVASASGPRLRIAVLPFLNLTGDQNLAFLGDGLTDEVISQLGLLSGDRLAVIARTSAMSYRNSPKTVAQIGSELDVTYVVESSVRRQGDGLRVSSRMIRVSDQAPEASWSEAFGPASSPDDLQQTRAATRLARLIALHLLPGRVKDPVTAPPVDEAAWTHFLRGKALTNSGSSTDVRDALGQFEAATTIDPGFAAAWAKVAEIRHVLVMMGALAPADAYGLARTAAEHALAADPNLPDAHLAMGLVQLWHDWRPADAARSFERALALNPSHAAALHDYGWSLVALGRHDEAIRQISDARAIDPLSTRANNDVGWLYLQLRQPAEAARACEHTLAVDAGSLEAQACLERAYAQRGLFDAALEAAQATLPPSSGFRAPPGASAEAALRSIWRWRLDQLEQAKATRSISPYMLATLRAALGETDRAIEDLERAYDDRVGMMVFLDRDPSLDPVRQQPRVQALIQRVFPSGDR